MWLLVLTMLGCTALTLTIACATVMPGRNHNGPLPPLSDREKSTARALRRHTTKLAGEIGERNVRAPKALAAAADYIASEFRAAGYAPKRLTYTVAGVACDNIEVEIAGRGNADEIVIVGAHYDSVIGCPGANDNATGVAGLLALARAFAGRSPARTLRFVAFVNEEPPHFWSERMGSLVYARGCRARNENIVAMLSLETIGYYTDESKSQKYPFPLNLVYPSTGNFVGFVGNTSSRGLVRRTVELFREHTRFPSQGAIMPSAVREAGWSDHWAFWQVGYPGLMITDTAVFRYPHYHMPSDTPERIDYERTARVVVGREKVIADLAETPR